MPSVSDLKQSKYLTKNDVEPPVVATITGYEEVNVAKEGAPQDMKYILHFNELEKPMCLNSTNGQIIAKITGSEDFDGWIGKRVELYNDPNVSYAGQLTGGIRVRFPAGAQRSPAKANGAAWPTFDDAVQYAMKEAGLSKPELITRMKRMNLNGYKPERDAETIRNIVEEAKAEAAFNSIPAAEPSHQPEEAFQ